MRKRPTLRRNNGSIVIRVRIDGEDKRIYRLGRWDDPVAVARAEAITAEIWSDIQRGELDESLSRYRPQVEEEESDLLRSLKHLMESKRQARVIHAYWTVQRYGRSIRTRPEAEGSWHGCSSKALQHPPRQQS